MRSDNLHWVVVYFDVARGKALAANFKTSEESYALQAEHPESSLYRGQVFDVPLGSSDDNDGKACDGCC